MTTSIPHRAAISTTECHLKTSRAIILAAGFGSRLSVDASHKLLTRVGKRSLLDRHLDNFSRLGIDEVIVVTGYDAEALTRAVNDHTRPSSISVRCAYNGDFEGQNGLSVLAGVDAFDDDQSFWLTMSDHLFDPALFDELNRRFDAERPDRWQGALVIDKKLETIFDMPDATKVRTDTDDFAIGKQLQRFDVVDAGLFWCGPGFVEALRAERRKRGDCSTSDAVRRLHRADRFGFWDLGDFLWQDIDTPQALAHAEKLLESKFSGS